MLAICLPFQLPTFAANQAADAEPCMAPSATDHSRHRKRTRTKRDAAPPLAALFRRGLWARRLPCLLLEPPKVLRILKQVERGSRHWLPVLVPASKGGAALQQACLLLLRLCARKPKRGCPPNPTGLHSPTLKGSKPRPCTSVLGASRYSCVFSAATVACRPQRRRGRPPSPPPSSSC